ncbi:MAG: alpha/beta hydrolase [Flavobacteriales bacterium]|nr:alpha/beta hydrolase [Flavobacteriales bacterium]
MTIYCISGLGADQRVFDKLSVQAELVHLEWIQPEANEDLKAYALRLAQKIDNSSPFCLLGVSFGGMIATEIGKALKVEKVILISTAEIASELPLHYRALGKTQVSKLIPAKWYDMPKGMASFLFGTDHKELLGQILDDTDPNFTKWAIGALTTWDNQTRLNNSFKIHGSNDRMIPLGSNPADHVIKNAGHFMVYDQADEVGDVINRVIDGVRR